MPASRSSCHGYDPPIAQGFGVLLLGRIGRRRSVFTSRRSPSVTAAAAESCWRGRLAGTTGEKAAAHVGSAPWLTDMSLSDCSHRTGCSGNNSASHRHRSARRKNSCGASLFAARGAFRTARSTKDGLMSSPGVIAARRTELRIWSGPGSAARHTATTAARRSPGPHVASPHALSSGVITAPPASYSTSRPPRINSTARV